MHLLFEVPCRADLLSQLKFFRFFRFCSSQCWNIIKSHSTHWKPHGEQARFQLVLLVPVHKIKCGWRWIKGNCRYALTSVHDYKNMCVIDRFVTRSSCKPRVGWWQVVQESLRLNKLFLITPLCAEPGTHIYSPLYAPIWHRQNNFWNFRPHYIFDSRLLDNVGG